MQAKVRTSGSFKIVDLIGQVSVESMLPFRDICLSDLLSEKVIFNLDQLHFVGSHGIMLFVQALKEFGERSSNGLKMYGVGSEFRQIFSASVRCNLEIYENEQLAVNSFAPMARPDFIED